MSSSISSITDKVIAIVPAAGIGARMEANIPKQYLMLDNKTILEHTLERLLAHQMIDKVVVALHSDDDIFSTLPLSHHQKIRIVTGGKNRADSVLAALSTLEKNSWVLVHDAARPCLTHYDIDKLLNVRKDYPDGAILAMPVRDTMKRADDRGCIKNTVCREQLWHAMTPQMFPSNQLIKHLQSALMSNEINVTDEASAMEWAGFHPYLVEGRADNIKITHPNDLPLAKLFIKAQGDFL